MAQHFLASPAARDLPLGVVFRLSEAAAYEVFKQARWPETNGEPVCPRCGCQRCYSVRRQRFKCSACRREFSVTSGTILAFHKLSFRQMLCAIALSANAVKGKAALHLSRELGVSTKTAYVLLMKLREAVSAERAHITLSGTVEVDALFIGGHVKPQNRRADRVDRRKTEHRSGKRLCILALRQRKGRIVTVVTREESSEAAWQMVQAVVAKPATIVADESAAYDDLGLLFPLRRTNHSLAWVSASGASTNQVESFFTRVRRSDHGIHHHIAGRYTDWYAAELAFREDMRRKGNGWLTMAILQRALAHPTSRNLCGYWQGVRPSMLIWIPTGTEAPRSHG